MDVLDCEHSSIDVPRNVLASLPETLSSWRNIKPLEDADWSRPWDLLRPFFKKHGYELYRVQPTFVGTANSTSSPARDSFGLYGNRGDGFQAILPARAVVFAARDRLNRDVVIKVVSKGTEGSRELDILQFLNTPLIRSDPANATVPVLQFLRAGDWAFVVMPFCDACEYMPMVNAQETFELTDQLLSALSFLHSHRIAHLDISSENILINHHGLTPNTTMWVAGWPVPLDTPPEFRSTFPVRYMMMGFGSSIHFSSTLPFSACLADPSDRRRAHKAPESSLRRYDPFAADVYQTGRLCYGWFSEVAHKIVPGFLELLRDMTASDPAARPTAAVALERLRAIRDVTPKENLIYPVVSQQLNWFPEVPGSV
ncbi:kinase-like protein [Artomyces pyxidatus]|uniref:Kinase-like protein n=1 Tax=Artomyces pyxidatus TaxID=48021 RepID=A0ACB8SM78_9AGAM|nr:kinase-like protein [Artomyces pyxidatus]